MFAVAFPLAPILALLNNLWEARLGLLKLKVREGGRKEGRKDILLFHSCSHVC